MSLIRSCLVSALTAVLVSAAENPLLQEWKTPFGLPPFQDIKEEHFVPAYEAAMGIHKKQIQAIVESKEKPSFKNTIEALERAGQELSRVGLVFGALNGAETNDKLQAIAKQTAPMLSAHRDDIRLNETLWQRVKAVWDGRKALKLNAEQSRLLQDTYKDFVRAGALLKPGDKDKLRKINGELSLLGVQYGERVLKATNAFKLVIDKPEDLAGLPQPQIAAAAEAAKKAKLEGKWLFTLHYPSIWPFMENAQNRELRKQLLNAYLDRCGGGELDTRKLASRIAALRVEKAQLLGYKTWADFILEENMAKNAAGVYGLLDQIWKPSLAKARAELADLQIQADKDKIKVEAWDWRYYETKARLAKFNLDEEDLKPYFSLDKVRDGAFQVASRLYGISFKEHKGLPTWHPEVRVFEVKEKDGRHVGLLLMDFHPRPGKRSGAWCGGLRGAQILKGKRVTPLITNVCNFARPSGDAPALLNRDEVRTLFHEFGHALHSLFYAGSYRALAGSPRDFVELPSQIMENWAMEPQVLKMYAKHWKTGETIPEALIQKIQISDTFGQGFATTEYMGAALLDLDWHTLTEPVEKDAAAFEQASTQKWGLLPEIPLRYRTPYFQHIFAGGYSAGYYSYIWSAVLDSDAFQAFVEKKNLFDPMTAKAFREKILSKGQSDDPATLYRNFRGQDPSPKALLKKRGLQ